MLAAFQFAVGSPVLLAKEGFGLSEPLPSWGRTPMRLFSRVLRLCAATAVHDAWSATAWHVSKMFRAVGCL